MQISKKTVIFLMIFSIILIGITIFAILYTSKNWKSQFSTVTFENTSKVTENSESSENVNQEPFSGTLTELSNTYKKNALNVKDNIVTEGNPVDGSDYSEKVKITYPEISNLADSNIRTNINENIREKVFSYYSGDVLNDTNVKHLEIKARAIANFSDVLSIRIDIVKEFVDGNIARDFTGLNFRLENGEQIVFNNLFSIEKEYCSGTIIYIFLFSFIFSFISSSISCDFPVPLLPYINCKLIFYFTFQNLIRFYHKINYISIK